MQKGHGGCSHRSCGLLPFLRTWINRLQIGHISIIKAKPRVIHSYPIHSHQHRDSTMCQLWILKITRSQHKHVSSANISPEVMWAINHTGAASAYQSVNIFYWSVQKD